MRITNSIVTKKCWISASELKEKEMNTESTQLFYNYTLG
ncbi:terminase large subunit [Staphylococcus phage vB_SurM-PSU4]|nr:terminase large subunit [Staphylococcus phage vB_SurM-PSU4]